MNTLTVVLVHGAFAESASWNGVIADLAATQITAIATPNQLRSVTTDAQNVRAAVDAIDGHVLLVGHSYGGPVITAAAAGSRKVAGLVYVAAFAPEPGETALGLTALFPGSTLGDTVRPIPLGDGTNDLFVDRALFPDQFAGDVALTDARIAGATQRPIRDFALNEGLPGDVAAWKSLPSWFVFGSADKNIPVEAHRYMAERAGSRKTVEVDGASHSVMVSTPTAVADLIREAFDALS
ncbi:alpha/beta fold hydrolase [Microbacterium sp. I2]|jgi:pimeloyl-ACP methyl ester carboxylesterase|uniref:Alpha/beta fold hydrolase n=1 Tax=Microbacterium terregens TaxID=69363 RepID=A0ABV5T4P2_9MICO